MSSHFKKIMLATVLGATVLSGQANDAVLSMKPAGYWPANEGNSEVIHDLSVSANHAKMVHVPWDKEKKLLDFTGAYQWLEIPANKAYQTPAFSMGGWVFIRSEVIGGALVMGEGFLLLGNRDWLTQVGIQLCVRRQETIDVLMDGKKDVLGTRLYESYKDGKRVERAYGKPNLDIGKWYHLIYTFEPEKSMNALPASPNLALTATLAASNDGGNPDRVPKNAIDGNPETSWIIWPDAGLKPDAKKWIQLNFDKEVSINRIRLINCPDSTGSFLDGKLLFSDGSVIDVSKFLDEWDGMFATKTVTWIRFNAPQTGSPRSGLKEFEVYKEDRIIYQEEGVVINKRNDKGVIGTGKLYLNGDLIASKDKISYHPVNHNLQIGNDVIWWHQVYKKSGSLDGTVRDMVWFDRALSDKEVEHLCEVTKPAVKPDVYDDTVIVLDGRAIAVKDLTSLPPATRRTALVLFGRKDAAKLKPLGDAFLPVLTAALDEANCRLPSAELLIKLKNDSVLQNALPKLVAAIEDPQRPEKERADAALALSVMGKAAAKAVSALAGTLDNLVPQDNVRPPRIEELLRNALTLALLNIDPKHAKAQEVLGRTFAAPMMKALDLENPVLVKTSADALRTAINDGKWMKAMELYAKLQPTAREYFFTYKAPQDSDYTATARFNGCTYKVGTGVAWQGVEKVPEDEYKTIVSELGKEYPTAKDWRKPEYEHLYRVPITKINADGTEQKIYLEGTNFILDGADQKCRAWSIFTDELGYVHVMGGQHNAPNANHYIPGSWEKMGVSRDGKNENYPLQMYWMSTKPESIDSFKFSGQRSNPQAIPAGYLNYICFVQSPSNETYLYGRAGGLGFQCWGMFRYDAAAKRWTAVGGDPYYLIESARRQNPDWLSYLHDAVRYSPPKAPSDVRSLVWAWQPPFYNFCRDRWGIRFDKTGRMHVRMAIAGLDGAGYVRATAVYAWSDDRGKTFYRADGSKVELPLTVNPAPEHNAEIDCDNTLQHHAGGQYATRQWLELWINLLQKAGYRI